MTRMLTIFLGLVLLLCGSTLAYLKGFDDGADTAACITELLTFPESRPAEVHACRRADRSWKVRGMALMQERTR